MRVAGIYLNKRFAGLLTEVNKDSYIYRYDDQYYLDATAPAISLTLPKTKQEHFSAYLFPFFFNMLAEGVNRDLQSRQLRIDREDSFGLLMATAKSDTIGAITVKSISDEHPAD